MRTMTMLCGLLVACGGTVDAPGSGDSTSSAPGTTPTADPLSCTSEARVGSLAEDARPALPQLVSDGAFAYWPRRGGGQAVADQIVRSPAGGGPIEVLASGASAEGLAVDDAHVYWTEHARTASGTSEALVRRVPKAGGAIETVLSTRVRLHRSADPSDVMDATGVEADRIAIDGDAIVFTGRLDPSHGGAFQGVFRSPKAPPATGERADVLVLGGPEPASPLAMTIDEAAVYWVVDPRDEQISDGSAAAAPALRSATKDAPRRALARTLASGATFASTRLDARFSLVADGESVYWLSQNDGTVVKVAKAGGAPTVLAADEHDFSAIAVRGGFVYWTWTPPSGALGGVKRVPTSGGPVTPLIRQLWVTGLAVDAAGVVVTGSALSRASCP